MKKNIYELLNDVKVDVAEFEAEKLSDQEVSRIQSQLWKEMNRMKKKEQNYKRSYRMKVAAAACAAVVLAGGVTAFASGMFNDEINSLISIVRGTKTEQEDVQVYEKVGAAMAQAEAEKGKMEQVTAEDQGLKLSVTDLFCDGFTLYYTATLQGDASLVNDADFIAASWEWVKELPVEQQTEDLVLPVKVNGVSTYVDEIFRRSENGDYVMMGKVDLLAMMQSGELDLTGVDTLDVEYQVRRWVGKDTDTMVQKDVGVDEQGDRYVEETYKETMSVDGDWKLAFQVPVDHSKNLESVLDKEENGIVLKKVTKTELGLVVEVEMPDLTQAPYNDPFNDPDIGVVSGDTCLQWLSGYTNLHEDNSSTYTFMVLYDGESDLKLQVTAKNETADLIAEIPFEAPGK